ncbi:MAG: PH domain-containing protein [Alphaproteobacteria bacterium]|nr:PH domain-containing protein [Alphaproteobacteria bacterium]
MSYVVGTLSKDEQIKEVAHLHWINYLTVVLCLALAIACIVLCFKYDAKNNQFLYILFGAPSLVFTLSSLGFLLRIFTTEMVVTTKRVVCRTGVISVHTEELKIGRIESVEIKQSILGRILGYGSLWFSGTGTGKVLFPNITDPRGIKSRMEDVIQD